MELVRFIKYTPELLNGQPEIYSYYILKETLTVNGASDKCYITPTNVDGIEVSLTCENAVGKIQYTLSNIQDIQNGNETWHDWDYGEINSYKDDVFHPVTAIRLYKVSGNGSVSLEARCQ